jgi:hypothetical protein
MNLSELFAQWQAVGIFAYALPFLLIFALIFGILSKINIFGTKENTNKGVNAIISLVIAFMSLQFNLVSTFFADLFPRFGIALSVILVILIAMGFLMDFENKNVKWIFTGITLVALIVVLWAPLSGLGFGFGSGFTSFLKENLGLIFFGIIFIGVIVWTIAGGKGKSSPVNQGPSN